MYELKTAIVSGASSEIGAEICKALSKSYHVIALYRNKERYDELLGNEGLCSVSVDITDTNDIVELLSYFEKKNIPFPSVLVNNAGSNVNGLCNKMSRDSFREVLETNVLGTFLMTKVFTPFMMEENWGRVVNISSITARTGAFGASAYAASKGAINSFTKSVAKEVGKKGVTVNSIELGFTNTGMIKDVPQYIVSGAVVRTPLGRLGRAEEVADVVAFLCSDSASFITGAVIPVTGGYA